MGDLDRVEAFLRWAWDSASPRIETSAFGTALFNDRFPSDWDGNLLRVDRAVDTSAADLIVETNRWFEGSTMSPLCSWRRTSTATVA